MTEIFHTMSSKKKHRCSKCNKNMTKQIGCGHLAESMLPTLADHRESEHTKKVKDPERAVRSRKKEFGLDFVGNPSMQTDPRHVVKRGRTLGGQQKEINREEFIRAAAKDDYMVSKAKEALKKKT